ncbi:hypothetical protein [Actinomadura sp. NEAU-AAG7]|uniref:hypothetical protein n=1 Tax=Actinomadura sp. NEAU-AAG7 TaxID=2839640 RepID=UPI001BE445F6|nr:hypothetical protein [Actinomadura sp. NEAU-AAG7]MBT2213487.1 hypothetical protein [Actinomadura sp. NEAU-AAG7]
MTAELLATPDTHETETRQGVMYDLTGPGGDVRWDPGDPATVEAARAAFDRQVGAGALAYRTDNPDHGGEQIREFAPDAAVVVLVQPLQGG